MPGISSSGSAVVEEGTSRGDRAPCGGGPRGPPRPPAPPHHGISVVGKAVWSVARAGKGWRFERAVGVDCSLPEPRCIWLTSLRNDNTEWWEKRWRRAGAGMARQKCRARPRIDRNFTVRELYCLRVSCLCAYVFPFQAALKGSSDQVIPSQPCFPKSLK